MKRVIFIVIALCLIYQNLNKEVKEEKLEEKKIIVHCLRSSGFMEEIELEEYVLGVLSAEMPASFELEALKAQAVAARTFVLSRDLNVDDSTSSQVYHDQKQRQAKWQDQYATYESKLREAVEATKGEVLMYDGNYISALFFSSSNGKTENNEDYFHSSAIPYLRCVSSDYEDPIVEVCTYSQEELSTYFVGNSDGIEVLNYTESGRVNEVWINGSVYTGREVREKLGLNSSDFEVKRVGSKYQITTFGYGHGVGMSQYGANGMALNGYNYEEILAHYYQGVSIINLN